MCGIKVSVRRIKTNLYTITMTVTWLYFAKFNKKSVFPMKNHFVSDNVDNGKMVEFEKALKLPKLFLLSKNA